MYKADVLADVDMEEDVEEEAYVSKEGIVTAAAVEEVMILLKCN